MKFLLMLLFPIAVHAAFIDSLTVEGTLSLPLTNGETLFMNGSDVSSHPLIATYPLAYTNGTFSVSLTATSPLLYSSGTLSIPVATAIANGYLSSTDWSTFYNKQATVSASSPIDFTANNITLKYISPLTTTNGSLSIPAATSGANGYLSSTDWSTFNGKQDVISATTPLLFSANTISLGTVTVAKGGTNRTTVVPNGNFLISDGSGYIAGTIAAGSNVTVSNVAGLYTISGSASGITSLAQGSGISLNPSTITGVGTISANITATAPILSSGTDISLGTVTIAKGGTNLTSIISAGNFLYSNGSVYSGGTLTAGTNISISDSSGNITITNTGPTGTVKSVYGANDLLANPSPITSFGTLSIGTLAVARGGTGLTSAVAAGNFLYSNGSAYSAGTIAAGTNVTVSNVAGVYTINSSSSGSSSATIVTTGTTYTASNTEDLILTTGTITINLYATSGNRGKKIAIKKTDSNAASFVTIDPNSSETIDGKTTRTIKQQYEEMILTTDGTNWTTNNRYRTPQIVKANISNNGACTIGSDPEGMLSSVSHTFGAGCAITFTTNFWDSTPECWCRADLRPSIAAYQCNSVWTSATAGSTYTATGGGADADRDYVLTCMGIRGSL